MEFQRLHILQQCSIFDSDTNDADFSSITSAAIQLLKVTMASVTFITADRLFFKSPIGFSLSETTREDSFANHVSKLEDPTDLFVVHDSHNNTRTREYQNYTFVKESPYLRFYVGVPIAVEGQIVGSLCVFDPQPRTFLSVDQRMDLLDLAHAAAVVLTERRNRIISKTFAIDRLVTQLLHDSLSPSLQDMTSSLSLLLPPSSSSGSSTPVIASQYSLNLLQPAKALSEALLRQSKTLLDSDVDPVGDDVAPPSAPPLATQPHTESLQDASLALCQLNSFVGVKTFGPRLSRVSLDGYESQNSDGDPPAPHRLQIPLRYTISSSSSEYLDQPSSEEQPPPLVEGSSSILDLRAAHLSWKSVTCSMSKSPCPSVDGESEDPTLIAPSSGNSSDLHDLLSYLQHTLPVSVSHFRTVWKIDLPSHLFQNALCSQIKCVIPAVNLLTSVLETVMTHIIMRTNQLEVSVEVHPLSDQNDVPSPYLPTDSKGYLLQDQYLRPVELCLSMSATEYVNTYYGGEVTLGMKSNEIVTDQHTSEVTHHSHHDFFVESVSVEELLGSLGVRTFWAFQEEKGGEGEEEKRRSGDTRRESNSSSGTLRYRVIVPCRLEMTFLPPEEIEIVKATDGDGQSDQKLISSTPVEPFLSPSVEPTLALQPNSLAPHTPTEIDTPKPTLAPTTPASKLRILIVDDSPAIQKILGRWFQRNDCDVDSALNGQLGVQAIQSADPPFDIVFMDFLMPVMDGLEAVRTYYRWINQASPEISEKFREMLIVGLSATANVGDQQEGIKVGMHHFIQKPADTKFLRFILDLKLQRRNVREISEQLKVGVVV
jgi:CheY-like chemotaxis protein